MRRILTEVLLAAALTGCGPSQEQLRLGSEVERLARENELLRSELRSAREETARVTRERDALKVQSAKPAAATKPSAPSPAPRKR